MKLTLIIIILFLIYIIRGYKKGFAGVVFSLVGWIVGIAATYLFTPIVAEQIVVNTEIPVVIEETLYEKLTTAVGELNVSGIEMLPEVAQQIIIGDYASVEELIQVGAVEAIDFTGLTNSIINIMAAVIVLILVRFLLYIIEKILGGISKLPLIGTANRWLGAVAGAAQGLLWSWIILALVSIATYTGYNNTLIEEVYASPILTWLYENNVIMNLVSSFM